MYFTIGGHPGFNVPILQDSKQTDYYLLFKKGPALSYKLVYGDSGTAEAKKVYALDLEEADGYYRCRITEMCIRDRAVTVRLTGDPHVLFQRMTERNNSSDRHRGHVVNDHYPEIKEKAEMNAQPVLGQEDFIRGITERGMADFQIPGPVLEIDTTDFSKVDLQRITEELQGILSNI